MEQNDSKKVLLSVLGVAILIVAVVGISFAALSYDKVGGTNTVTTGTVSMSFTESTKGIILTDALPIGDTTGIALKGDGQYFDFSVTSTTSSSLAVSYEINVTPTTVSGDKTALTDEQVKIYLEKKNGDDYNQDVAPVLVSTLTGSSTRSGSKILKTVTNTVNGTQIDEYRLRIWIDENVDITTLNEKAHEYRLVVNVDAKANPIGK